MAQKPRPPIRAEWLYEGLDNLEGARGRGVVVALLLIHGRRREGQVDANGDVLEGCRRVEQAVVDAGKRSMVIVNDGVPELRGVALGHFHNLVGIAVADEICLCVCERMLNKPLSSWGTCLGRPT